MLMIILVTCLLISFILFVLRSIFKRKHSINGSHVLITGGSSGIGKCLAIEAVTRGANVTLFARDKTKLEAAEAEIQRHLINKDQKIKIVSVDISIDHSNIEKVVSEAEAQLGPIEILINCAGYAISARFEETPIEEFHRLLNVNYIGSVYVTRAVTPGMKLRKKGRILFVSSQAGLLGVYGYTAYSASKFALRGLAEALNMELKPFNIKITMGFPSDTDTPGFAEEEKTKPIETKVISATSALFSPNIVAKSLMEDTLQGKFMSSLGVEGSILCTLCAGMAPVSSFTELITQVFTMGVFRFVAFFILGNFNRIVVKYAKNRDYTKKDS